MRRPNRLSSSIRRAPTRYEPVSRIAAGGMAEVWRADAVLESGEKLPVAIKRVLPKLAGDPYYRSMFEDESRLGMLLRHPNIVRVFDARDAAGTYIMVMELVDGTSLKSLLDRAHERRACMPVPTALYLVREIGAALRYAHEATDLNGKHLGIVHRDVSPHNVLLSRDGDVKLSDFGLANASVHRTVHARELVGGKLGYLAPEVVMQKTTDLRIDLFATGIVLWEALTGRRLFQGKDDGETVRNVVRKTIEPASTYNPQVTPDVDSFVARLLERAPDRRIGSARQLVQEATQLLARIDRKVGARDVSLLVGLHLAAEAVKRPPEPKGIDYIARELDAFVAGAGGSAYDIGAEPLDPEAFVLAGQPASGVRPMPEDEDDTGKWPLG